MGRYSAKANNCGGPGWNVIDNTTGRSVAWIYDQEYGHKYPKEDEQRAEKFAAMLNSMQE